MRFRLVLICQSLEVSVEYQSPNSAPRRAKRTHRFCRFITLRHRRSITKYWAANSCARNLSLSSYALRILSTNCPRISSSMMQICCRRILIWRNVIAHPSKLTDPRMAVTRRPAPIPPPRRTSWRSFFCLRSSSWLGGSSLHRCAYCWVSNSTMFQSVGIRLRLIMAWRKMG